MDFYIDLLIFYPDLYGLTDDCYLCAVRHNLEQLRNILGIEPQAAVSNLPSDRPRPVRAVYQIASERKPQGVRTERISGTRRNDIRQFGPLLFYGLRHMPARLDYLLYYLKVPHRRIIAVVPYAYRESPHHHRPLLIKKVIEPHLGEVHNYPFIPFNIGQYPHCRQFNIRELPRKKRIYRRIRIYYLVVTEIELARHLYQGFIAVYLMGLDDTYYSAVFVVRINLR